MFTMGIGKEVGLVRLALGEIEFLTDRVKVCEGGNYNRNGYNVSGSNLRNL